MNARHAVVVTLAVASLVACRDRNGTSNTGTVVTTVPTQVQPPPPMPPMPPMPPTNALADGGAQPVLAPAPMPPVPDADASAPPVAAPTPPTDVGTTVAHHHDAGPADPQMNIPSPIQGVPGVRVREGRHGTDLNVGGIRINLPQ